MPRTAWVLWWRYPDGSAVEIVRTYDWKSRADADFELLTHDNSGKDWGLTEVARFMEDGDV